MENKKLTAKDFITVGIFTAIVFVVTFVCMMLGFIHPYVVASYVIIMPIVGAIPMMLFYCKVEKFGMITIMSVLFAIIMFIFGMGFLGAPFIVLAGVIADLVAKKGGYKNFKYISVSYGIYCLWICANYFPLIVTAEAYRQNLLDEGYSVEYCDSLFRAVNGKTIIVLMLISFICGYIGAYLGRAVVKKHFEKAGIV
ncbi:MAG: Trep_Strep domain-containing protein [Pseudobutyrivibrio ruminis]|nr:Trep_Strep domain-containing protein [Pseudobutyrivibrio ruminis]